MAGYLEETDAFHLRVQLTDLRGHPVTSRYPDASVEQLVADFSDIYGFAIRLGGEPLNLAALIYTALAPTTHEEGQRPSWPKFPAGALPVTPQLSWGSFWAGSHRDNDLRHNPAGHVYFFKSAKPVKARELAPGVALVAEGILAVPRLARWPMSYTISLAEIPARLLK